MPSRVQGRPDTVVIAFIGDIVGHPGRDALKEFLPRLREEEGMSLCIANAENAAGGTGLTPSVIDDLLDLGLDVLTSGNHIWAKREVIGELDIRPNVIRPANYPPGAPGSGTCLVETGGMTIGVLNLCGRVFMNPLDCPFQVGDRLVNELRQITPVIVVDMHAEATSEKLAMGFFLDGRVSAVIGTHTHVQTSDARLLPKGTAYMSDAGMTGPSDSILGIRKEIIITRFLTQMPQKFEVARHAPQMEGAVLEVERLTGRALGIRSFRYAAS